MVNCKKIKSAAGFSLIELIVSVFIIATIASVFLANYHSTNKRSELNIVKQKLASDIRLAQNYSLGSKTYDGVNLPQGGWGVYFALANPNQYIIFADGKGAAGNKSYDAGEAVEIRTLPTGVTIDYLSPAATVDIIFLPPDPTVYINGSASGNAQIRLKENINNSTALVTVNFFGLIDAN